jgi:hypothetical protein
LCIIVDHPRKNANTAKQRSFTTTAVKDKQQTSNKHINRLRSKNSVATNSASTTTCVVAQRATAHRRGRVEVNLTEK